MLEPLTKLFKRKSIASDIKNETLFGWHPLGNNTLAHFRDNQYDNGYASITKIVNEFTTILPYTIDANGKKVDSNLTNRLYHPNQDMSSLDFRAALAVMALVHDRVFVLAWRTENGEAVPGGEVTPDNLAGFTFLENPAVYENKGVKTYTVDGKTFTDKEVIELKDINPYNLSRGYSPAKAAKKWASIDDYIAAYQAGFFENGAVPSGQFIITAPTQKDFNDQVDRLEAKHKGAGKNNNIVYVHRPIDQNDGKPLNAQIEWVPFNVDNKSLDLKNIFEQVNQKIDSVYGVPASIRGVNDANTYASVRMDEQIFIKYVVKPFAMKVWTRFTHQLNRVTGGLGVAISFQLDIPGVADEEKVQAETKAIETTTVLALSQQGYSLDSIVDALQLSPTYKLLKTGNGKPQIDNDKPDVDTGDEVGDAPAAPDGSGAGVKGAAKRPDPKAVKAKRLPADERARYEQELSVVVRAHVQRQIDAVIDSTKSAKAVGDPTPGQTNDMAEEMLKIITGLMVAEGVSQTQGGISLLVGAGLDIGSIKPFVLRQETIDAYRGYLLNVAESYSMDTAISIRQVLSDGQIAGWTRAELEDNLREIMKTSDWRVTRMSVTEVNRASNMGSMQSMVQIKEDTGYDIVKEWVHFGDDTPCVLCDYMIGTKVPVDQTFLKIGDSFVAEDGTLFVNTFVDMDVPDVHPNGHCGQAYVVRS